MEVVPIKTVIMAGGRGTRISSVASDIPKPMIPICGKPVLQHEIECLREQGFTDILLTVGYLSDVIVNYFGDGSAFDVKIDYFVEKEPLGNAGALFRIKDRLTDDFLLLNADALFHIDFDRFVRYHKEKRGLVTLFTHPNSHPYDSGLIVCDDDHAVTGWLLKEDARPPYYKNRVNAGLHVMNKRALDVKIDTPKVDLDRQILKPLAGTGKMFAYDSPEYVKDMGTPDRYYAVSKDFSSGLIEAKNLRRKQKAIFLDRDGTVNKYVGFLTDAAQLELIDGVPEAIRAINASGYLAVVVTNQPVIARGEVTLEELNGIHNKMETLLGNEGAYLDAIYFCPHHPHKGYAGERPEYKIECDCRKPKPGMLIKAAADLNVDLSASWMIGDGDNDVLAGQAAGCKTVKLENGLDLLGAVRKILGEG